jgi:hypothetical protein
MDCVFPVSVDGGASTYLGRPRLYLIAAFALIPIHLALYGLLRVAKILRPSLSLGGLLATEKRLRLALLNVAYCCLSLLHTPVLMQWMNIFICKDNPDETASLHAAPGLDCYTEAWHTAQVEASVSFAIWGILYPLLLGLRMRRRHEDEDFISEFSLIVYGFRKKRFWWEPFGMLRRVLLAVILVVCRSQGYGQAAFVAITLTGFIVVSLLTHPFLNPVLTIVHVLADVTVLLIVVSGIVSTNSNSRTRNTIDSNADVAPIASVVLVRIRSHPSCAHHNVFAAGSVCEGDYSVHAMGRAPFVFMHVHVQVLGTLGVMVLLWIIVFTLEVKSMLWPMVLKTRVNKEMIDLFTMLDTDKSGTLSVAPSSNNRRLC